MRVLEIQCGVCNLRETNRERKEHIPLWTYGSLSCLLRDQRGLPWQAKGSAPEGRGDPKTFHHPWESDENTLMPPPHFPFPKSL
jgi:hypothetical protein